MAYRGFNRCVNLNRLNNRGFHINQLGLALHLELGLGLGGSEGFLLYRNGDGFHNLGGGSHNFLHVLHGGYRINSINRSQQPIREQLTSDGLRNLITPIALILLDHNLLLGICIEDLDGNALSHGNRRKICMSTRPRPIGRRARKQKKRKKKARRGVEPQTRNRQEQTRMTLKVEKKKHLRRFPGSPRHPRPGTNPQRGSDPQDPNPLPQTHQRCHPRHHR